MRLNPQYREEKRHRQETKSFDGTFEVAFQRVQNQRGAHVHVIMGNSPYSKGQSDINDNIPNIEYPGKSAGGTRTPVSIIILVKNPKKGTHEINYYSIEDQYHSGPAKRARVKELGSIEGISDWQKIMPDKNFDWVDQRDDSFSQYLPMGSKNTKLGTENTLFHLNSNGIVTARDTWVYNFNKSEISKNMKRQIEYCKKLDFTDMNLDRKKHDPKKVSWSPDLSKRLKNKKLTFDKNKIRIAQYRPFVKQYLYFDHTFNHRASLIPRIFPKEKSENLVISIPTKIDVGKFLPLISNTIPDFQVLFNSICFPLYTYDSDDDKKTENITDFALEEYRIFYNDKKISKKDIFYYVYGLLHHTKYRKKFANNLSKEFPHIPMAPNFWEFVKGGKKLADIHLNYENCKKYPLGLPKNKNFGKLVKISFGRKKIDEKWKIDYSEIWVNGVLVFDNIPEMDYHVNKRTPLEWIVERYKVRFDKDSEITNDPGDVDIISIIERAVHVGVESDKIIKELPEEFEPKDWSPRKTGLDKFA